MVLGMGYGPLLPVACAQEVKQPADAKPPVTPEKVQDLIKKLGAADFTVRQRAQQELARLGLFVFEDLQEAQQSDDIEISLRARQLVRGMNVQWFTETDLPEVAKVLKGYGEQSDADRSSRIDFLAKMSNRDGAAALCRLARYEPSSELSKRAALQLLQLPAPETSEGRESAAKQIEDICGSARRPAGQWLRLYAQTLRDSAKHADAWKKVTQEEQVALQNQPGSTSREIVRDLHRFHAILLKQIGRSAESLDAMRAAAALATKDATDLAEHFDWLVVHEGFVIIDELAAKSGMEVHSDPKLLYLLAESLLRRGDKAAAEKMAAEALALHPREANHHAEIAVNLQQRGLFAWSEAEFRAMISIDGRLAPFGLLQLSEMLHDIQEDERAGLALKDLLDRGLKDEFTRNWLEERSPIDSRRARMHYFFYCDALKKGDLAKAKGHLLDAIVQDPTEADVLIALYRLPNQTEAEKRDTKALIDNTAEKFVADVKEASEPLEELGGTGIDGLSIEHKRYLGMACNQYAWLVSNTYGDFDEALRCGLLAVEIDPKEAGRIDTLARCYYAKGDVDSAIRSQSMANKLEPHSGAIARQLKFFQEEKARRAGTEAKPKS